MCKGKTGFSLVFFYFLQIKFFKKYSREIISQSVIYWKLMVIPQDSPVMLASFAVGVGLVFTTSGFIYSLRYV